MGVCETISLLLPQNDESTEDLHILGAEDLSMLAGKVSILDELVDDFPFFTSRMDIRCSSGTIRPTWGCPAVTDVSL